MIIGPEVFPCAYIPYCALQVGSYRYYNPETMWLDFDALMMDLMYDYDLIS